MGFFNYGRSSSTVAKAIDEMWANQVEDTRRHTIEDRWRCLSAPSSGVVDFPDAIPKHFKIELVTANEAIGRFRYTLGLQLKNLPVRHIRSQTSNPDIQTSNNVIYSSST
jgi:hypothetical protein